jgi:hypothetical protein
MYIQSLPITPVVGKDLGSGFMPKLIAVAIIILSVIEFVLTMLKKKDKKKVSSNSTDMKGGILTIVSIASYALFYDYLGFLLSTTLYLFIQMVILSNEDNRKVKTFAIISIASSAVIYVVFNNVIGMQLPAGILEI